MFTTEEREKKSKFQRFMSGQFYLRDKRKNDNPQALRKY